MFVWVVRGAEAGQIEGRVSVEDTSFTVVVAGRGAASGEGTWADCRLEPGTGSKKSTTARARRDVVYYELLGLDRAIDVGGGFGMGMRLMRLSTWLRRAVGLQCRREGLGACRGRLWLPGAPRRHVCGTTGGRRRDRNSVRERDRGKDVEWGKYREMASAPVRLCVG